MFVSFCDCSYIVKVSQMFSMLSLYILSDEGIDKETFLSLEESGNLNDLIPKIGPRVKFRKRLREYLQVLCFCMI